MLTTQDLLNICVGIGFLVLVGFVSIAFYQLSLTLKSIRVVSDEVGRTAKDISVLKSEVQVGFWSLIKKLLGSTERR